MKVFNKTPMFLLASASDSGGSSAGASASSAAGVRVLRTPASKTPFFAAGPPRFGTPAAPLGLLRI